MKTWLLATWETETGSDNGPYWEDRYYAVELDEEDAEATVACAVDAIDAEIGVNVDDVCIALCVENDELTAAVTTKLRERAAAEKAREEARRAVKKAEDDARWTAQLRERIAKLESGSELESLRRQLATAEGKP